MGLKAPGSATVIAKPATTIIRPAAKLIARPLATKGDNAMHKPRSPAYLPSGTASKIGLKAPESATVIGQPATVLARPAAKLIARPLATKGRDTAVEKSISPGHLPSGTASKTGFKAPQPATMIGQPVATIRPAAKVIARPHAAATTRPAAKSIAKPLAAKGRFPFTRI